MFEDEDGNQWQEPDCCPEHRAGCPAWAHGGPVQQAKGSSDDVLSEQAPAARHGDGADDRPQARGDRRLVQAVAEEPWPEPLAEIAAATAELERPEHDGDVQYVRMSAHLLQWQYALVDLSGLSIGETLRGLGLLSRLGTLATRPTPVPPGKVEAVCRQCGWRVWGYLIDEGETYTCARCLGN